MVAVIDIGNTNVHLGLYKKRKLVKTLTCPTTEKSVEKKIAEVLAVKKLQGIAIASVVPLLTQKFVDCFNKKLGINPLIVSTNLNLPIKLNYYDPATLGADRIAVVVGGLMRYKTDLIIIDFGTATTFEVVLNDGDYLGGLIMPGIKTSLEILSAKTALLPIVKFKSGVKTIGRSTEECIQSGVMNGTIAMVTGLVRKIRKVCRKNFLCIATGGWAKLIGTKIEEIKNIDPDLCLFGILNIYYDNRKD